MKHQRGVSFFGIIFLIAILGVLVSVAIKTIPPWLDYLTVSDATKSILSQPRIDVQRNDEIIEAIKRQLSINNISLGDLGKDAITITREDGVVSAEINYVVENVLFESEEVTLSIAMAFYKVHEARN